MYGPTKEEFLAAFLYAWNSVYREREDEILAVYNNRRLWTELMCGEENALSPSGSSILQVTLEQLRVNGRPVEFDRERHKVDAYGRVKVGSERGDFTDWVNVVMVEVENDVESTHEEYWKLIHSRCPLKVLVTYDYNSPALERELRHRLESMHREAAAVLGPDRSVYVLIVGGREGYSPSGKIAWRLWALGEDDTFIPLSIPAPSPPAFNGQPIAS